MFYFLKNQHVIFILLSFCLSQLLPPAAAAGGGTKGKIKKYNGCNGGGRRPPPATTLNQSLWRLRRAVFCGLLLRSTKEKIKISVAALLRRHSLRLRLRSVDNGGFHSLHCGGCAAAGNYFEPIIVAPAAGSFFLLCCSAALKKK